MSPARLTGAILGALLVLFIIGPLLRLLLEVSPATLGAAAADPEVRGAIALTVLAASAATLIALLLGVPLGYALARYRLGQPELRQAQLSLL